MKKKKPHSKPISFYPLKFDDVIKACLETNPLKIKKEEKDKKD